MLLKKDHYRWLYILLNVVLTVYSENDCTWYNYDFSVIGDTTWTERVVAEDNNVTTYAISLCSPLNIPDCYTGTSICSNVKDKHSVLGHYPAATVIEDEHAHEITFTYTAGKCEADPDKNVTTVIIFKCGKTLGSPIFVDTSFCDTIFEWYTTAACKSPPSEKEVRCYVFDDQNNKRDLSALIHTKGGIYVEPEESNPDHDIYINICRDITPDGNTATCPVGSSACSISKRGDKAINIGRVTQQLKKTGDNVLSLTYNSNATVPGCTQSPTTSITLRCPARGQNKRPRLLSSSNCQYVIEWETEHACSEKLLTSHECKLDEAQHGVGVDLTPLTKDGGYEVLHDEYKYVLNVCGKLDIECPDSADPNLAALQLKPGESSFCKKTGLLSKQTLRYADDKLSLIYRGGTTCSSNYQRETIINFNCNKTVDVGAPKYSEVLDRCTYVFDWDTKYACTETQKSGNCLVNHEDQVYDLTALMKTSDGDGNILALGGADNENYYINICSELIKSDQTSGCPSTAAVCKYDTKTAKGLSLGQYKSDVTYMDAHTVQLHYTEGDSCGGNKKIETFIQFICKPGKRTTEPKLTDVSSDRCVYHFEWHTATACVQKTVVGSDCKVQDTDSGINYDLSPLTKKSAPYYTLTYKKYLYTINICGEFIDDTCSMHGNTVGACQVIASDNSEPHITGQSNTTLTYYDGTLRLLYTNGDPYHDSTPRSTEIIFVCNDAGPMNESKLSFLAESDHTYSFEFHTKYACPSVPVECVAEDDQGKKYDLSSLTKPDGGTNWEITADDSKKYYINMCSSLNTNSISSSLCDSRAAVCQTDITGGAEKVLQNNFGEAKDGPQFVDGQVQIVYTSSEQCQDFDGENTFFTTKIVFKPSKTEEGPSTPVQIGKCQLVFDWLTPLASPVEEVEVKADNCTIADPNSGYMYNFKLLNKPEGYSVSHENDTYKINICGAHPDCKNNITVGCKGDTLLTLGETGGNIELVDDGLLKLTYLGDRSKVTENRIRLEIFFVCNTSIPRGSPVFKEHRDSTYSFDFHTSLACHPAPIECIAFDKDQNEYDLKPLEKTFDNWRVVDTQPMSANHVYYINVCRPINTITGYTCDGVAVGGCQVDSVGKTHNMGSVQSGPLSEGRGTVSLKYLNGEVCHKGKSNASPRSTSINFECAAYEHDPLFSNEIEETCEYIFTWLTPSACPLKTEKGINCQVTDPVFKHTFDLSVLRNEGDKDYDITLGEYKYLFNVCGGLRTGSGECTGSADVGVCQIKDGESTDMGKFSHELTYRDGEIKLTYTKERRNCKTKYDRQTIIKFTCDQMPTTHTDIKNLTQHDECTMVFEWPTHLACIPASPNECSYRTSDGKEYDLTPLIQSSANYETPSDDKGDKVNYLINVCAPVIHKRGAACKPNSAVCQVKVNSADKTKQYTALGDADSQTITEEDGHLVLKYENGDDCRTGGKGTTVIVFSCPKHGETEDSEPVYMATDDGCHYHFIWTTKIACPVNGEEKTGSNCQVTSPNTGYTYSLSQLNIAQGYEVQRSSGPPGEKFRISVCSSLSQDVCEPDSGSCKTSGSSKINYGLSNSKLTYISREIIQLSYTNGSDCADTNSKHSTLIEFTCGADIGQPVYLDSSDECNVQISWITSLACETEKPCTVETDNGIFDLSELNNANGYFLASSSSEVDLSFYVSVCRPLNTLPGKQCSPGSTVCAVSGDGSKTMSLGRVDQSPQYTNQEISLTYNRGDSCASGKKATTVITFSCKKGLSMGTPEYKSKDETKCRYNFVWETNVVCPESEIQTPTDCAFTDGSTGYKHDFNTLKNSPPFEVPRTDYVISICQTLGGAATSGCGGASVCKHKASNTGTSYGKQLSFIKEGKRIKMGYTDGADCPDDKSTKLSSYILFSCNRDMEGKGTPQLVSDDGCTALFTWDSPQACTPPVLSCEFPSFELTALSLGSGKQWEVEDGHWINLCQPVYKSLDKCRMDSIGCIQKGSGALSLGKVQTQTVIQRSDTAISIQYTNGSQCTDGGNITTRIHFTCGKDNGSPQYKHSNDPCLYEYTWETKYVCEDNRVGGFTTVSTNAITGPRTKTVGMVVGVFLVALAVCILALVFHKAERRVAFKNAVRNVFRRRGSNDQTYRYSRHDENTKTESISDHDENGDVSFASGGGNYGTDFGNVQTLTDSDDELLL